MNTEQFFQQLEARIAKYDLLCHPFYKAWSAGELTTEDLRAYAQDYYHHVKAFPTYLAELAVRLDESELRRAVLAKLSHYYLSLICRRHFYEFCRRPRMQAFFIDDFDRDAAHLRNGR